MELLDRFLDKFFEIVADHMQIFAVEQGSGVVGAFLVDHPVALAIGAIAAAVALLAAAWRRRFRR